MTCAVAMDTSPKVEPRANEGLRRPLQVSDPAGILSPQIVEWYLVASDPSVRVTSVTADRVKVEAGGARSNEDDQTLRKPRDSIISPKSQKPACAG